MAEYRLVGGWPDLGAWFGTAPFGLLKLAFAAIFGLDSLLSVPMMLRPGHRRCLRAMGIWQSGGYLADNEFSPAPGRFWIFDK